MTSHDEIKARCEAATPGPWYEEGWALPTEDGEYIELIDDSPADAIFIAHAREDIPFLLAENEAKDKQIADLTARAEKSERERDELKALCRPVCPVCGLENDRHFQGILCDRCGADIRGAQEEE